MVQELSRGQINRNPLHFRMYPFQAVQVIVRRGFTICMTTLPLLHPIYIYVCVPFVRTCGCVFIYCVNNDKVFLSQQLSQVCTRKTSCSTTLISLMERFKRRRTVAPIESSVLSVVTRQRFPRWKCRAAARNQRM